MFSTLVTGGAGYIGSHMVLDLLERGEGVVVLDDLSTGFQTQVADGGTFVRGDVGDSALVRSVIEQYHIDGVIHFAGSVVVPESVENPLKYYENNTSKSRTLVETCVRAGAKNFVFSSTAAVYGAPEIAIVKEDAPKRPLSPYGRSKLMTEWMLSDTADAHDFNYTVLRYFNVAGADPNGRTGQSTRNATHLIKRALQVALGQAPYLEIYGTDYPTPDGTGVRDYIHVSDLTAAHLLALDALRNGTKAATYNCGYGRGLSVREIANTVSKITGRPLPCREMPARPGDLSAVVADSSRLKETLNWHPKFADIETIVGSAFAWEKKLAAKRSGEDKIRLQDLSKRREL